MTTSARIVPTLLLLALLPSACSDGSETSASEPTGQITSASQGDSVGTDSESSSSGTSGSSTSDEICSDPESCTTSSTSGTSGSSGTSGTSSGTTGTTGDLPSDPCAETSDGLHCGSTLGGLANHQSLYQCMDGKTYSVSVCDYGCANDLCNKPPKDDDPCDGAKDGNGDYCGGTLPDGDADTLYTCIDGTTSATKPCQQGCQVNPPGTADTCNVADLCQYAESGSGAYCGSSLKGGIADNVLFQCVDKKTQNQQTCSEGCIMMPPGEPDICAPQQGGDECCLGKPPGTLTQSYSACGDGGAHYGIDLGTATGTPIYAGITGTVVGIALGYANCYNAQTMSCSQSCWNSFNYIKIKSDCGDPSDQANDLHVYYLHIDGVPGGIAQGVHVDQGQLLAYSGNSGCSTGPHIHIETASVAKGQPAVLSTCSSKNPADLYCQ